MWQIEIFSEMYPEALQKKINEWLDTNKSKVDFAKTRIDLSVAATSSSFRYTAVIWYFRNN